jgi:hypothetical protein
MKTAAVETATTVEATAAASTTAAAMATAKPNFGRESVGRLLGRRRRAGAGERHRVGALLRCRGESEYRGSCQT